MFDSRILLITNILLVVTLIIYLYFFHQNIILPLQSNTKSIEQMINLGEKIKKYKKLDSKKNRSLDDSYNTSITHDNGKLSVKYADLSDYEAQYLLKKINNVNRKITNNYDSLIKNGQLQVIYNELSDIDVSKIKSCNEDDTNIITDVSDSVVSL